MRLGNSRLGARRVNPFTQPISKPKAMAPEQSWWFWNPNRIGVEFPDEQFAAKLKELDPKLRVTKSPIHKRWLVWVEKPNLSFKLCTGWNLLFVVQNRDGSYCPLDERVFARLYSADALQWGGAKNYFDATIRENERAREKAEKNRRSDVDHASGEYFDYMSIKNIGSGSKFANHFA